MSTRNNISPLQKRRLNFLRTVKVFFKKHPEHFKGMARPVLYMVAEEIRELAKPCLVCHLPGRGAAFRGEILENGKIVLAEVILENKKIF